MLGFVSLFLMLFLSISSIEEVVDEFHHLETRESEDVFVKNYTLSSQPSILAYVCAVEMKQAKYSFNPIVKLKIFKQTKKKLDSLIKSHPADIHLRYIRLVLQEKTPVVLGYNNNIEEDKVFLRGKLETADASDYLDLYIQNNTSL